MARERNEEILPRTWYCYSDFKDLPTSAIIGSVELDDIQYHEAYPDAFAEDFQYHWFLKNAKLFDEPIRNVKGKLFLWDYEYNETEM